MPDLSELEYQALRATIRERGTFRVCTILVGLAAWGALSLGLVMSDLAGGVTMVPLVVLAGTFEISFFVHTGVERVGRYVQVFYEEARSMTGWETVAMNYGGRFPSGLDPLFTGVFASATVVDFASAIVLTTGRPGWVAISFIAHLVFAWRLAVARRASAGQRALDLERFRALRSQPPLH
ncbi:MAG: hypothetical protein ND807_17205 [Vicinamibacterales bacterium]|nr:hypothetical protein [Vicinamibacterales bacterium]